MRKTLIGGSLLAIFLLLMLPAVAAEEVKIAQSATIDTTYIEAILQKYRDNPSPQPILLTLAILFLKLLRLGVLLIDGIILLIILRIIRGSSNNTSAVC